MKSVPRNVILSAIEWNVPHLSSLPHRGNRQKHATPGGWLLWQPKQCEWLDRYFSFKDLDENKPSGSIRIRVETIDYFLRRYREDIIERHKKEKEIEIRLQALRRSLQQEQSKPYQLAMAGD